MKQRSLVFEFVITDSQSEFLCFLLGIHTLDHCAEGAEFFLEVLVSALYIPISSDSGVAVSGQSRKGQGCACAGGRGTSAPSR